MTTFNSRNPGAGRGWQVMTGRDGSVAYGVGLANVWIVAVSIGFWRRRDRSW